MIYTFSYGPIPQWLRERVEAQGLINVVSVLQSFSSLASTNGDSAAAALFSDYATAIGSTPGDSIAFAIGVGRIGRDFIG